MIFYILRTMSKKLDLPRKHLQSKFFRRSEKYDNGKLSFLYDLISETPVAHP